MSIRFTKNKVVSESKTRTREMETDASPRYAPLIESSRQRKKAFIAKIMTTRYNENGMKCHLSGK